MESEPTDHETHDPRSLLAVADQSRQRLVGELRLPAGLLPVLAAAVAAQIATAAWGIADQSVTGLGVVAAGLAVFLGVAAAALHRFRRANGVRVDGLASRVVLGSGTIASTAYLGSLAAAVWAAFSQTWWVVGVAAVAGGVGYALGARQWWHAYRQDPVPHARGASPRVLAGLAVAACLGFVALVVVGR
ncbi:hypothetical protein [Oryzobacter terrae]|uniref:hypothetical protein n=1 Tax=Oryzobacter terrae TaxID=1620385 RepID=UPI00366D1865